MNLLLKSISQDIVSEKATKDAEYTELQRKLQESTKTLAEKRKQLVELRSHSEQLERVEQSIANLESAKSNDTFDWTGRAEQSVEVDVLPTFRRRKDPTPPPSTREAETKSEAALTTKSSTEEDLVMLRRMKLWHNRIFTLLTTRQASKEGLATEKENQLRKLVALCTGFSVTETDEVCDTRLPFV